MKLSLIAAWLSLRSSYWFIPLLLNAAAIALSYSALAIDHALGPRQPDGVGWVFGGGADGARALLSALAASMMTVTGVTFSVVMVALTLASSQFGPHLLVNFRRDVGSQVVLGTFLATFLYSLLVLGSVRSTPDALFVPTVAVTVAVALAVVSVGLLIYFVHHVSQLIDAEHVIVNAWKELNAVIDDQFPAHDAEAGGDNDESPAAPSSVAEGVVLPARRAGYVQAIDHAGLLRLATMHDLRIDVLRHPGNFIEEGESLVRVEPVRPAADRVSNQLLSCIGIGDRRTPGQDTKFVVDQLVEITVRALSPGINEPFTATACVDRLSASLARLAGRREAPAALRASDGTARVRLTTVTMASIIDAAFNHIRPHLRSNAPVALHVLQMMGRLAAAPWPARAREALRQQAQLVKIVGQEGVPESDRQELEAQYEAVIKTLEQAGADLRQ